MTKLLTTLLSVVLPALAWSQTTSLFSKGEKAANVHHIGEVWLNELAHPDSNFHFNVSYAVFAPGARLDWHAHPGGQVLLMTEGVGFYQEKGQPKQVVRRGDVIRCPAGVEHWHGATPETSVAYLATTPTQKGRTVWAARVSDAEYYPPTAATTPVVSAEQAIVQLSKDKWRWMADRKVDSLSALLDEKVMFVHMGGNMNKAQELEVIQSGRIQYKHAEIQETSVQFIGNTAILLSKIRLTAVVGGNEVINPFTVTEVYVRQNDAWKLGSLSFSKLLGP
jgi:4-carboxymuconolactone decarboxylase